VSSTKIHPALKIAENCERSLRACLREFGLTPQSREKVKPARDEDADENKPSELYNEFSEFESQ